MNILKKFSPFIKDFRFLHSVLMQQIENKFQHQHDVIQFFIISPFIFYPSFAFSFIFITIFLHL